MLEITPGVPADDVPTGGNEYRSRSCTRISQGKLYSLSSSPRRAFLTAEDTTWLDFPRTYPPTLASKIPGRESDKTAKGRNKRRLAQTAATPEQEEYEVKRIWDEREVKRRKGKSYKQYLVQWTDSWVDECDLDAPDLLREFRAGRVRSYPTTSGPE